MDKPLNLSDIENEAPNRYKHKLSGTQQTYKRTYANPKTHNGIEYRSTMEKDFAVFLESQGIEFLYEPEEIVLQPKFQFTDKTTIVPATRRTPAHPKIENIRAITYKPDFYLPAYKLYVEVKGFQFNTELFKMKLKMLKRAHPGIAIYVVTSHSQFWCKSGTPDILRALQAVSHECRILNTEG